MNQITITISPIRDGFYYSIKWPNGGSVSGPCPTYEKAVEHINVTLREATVHWDA